MTWSTSHLPWGAIWTLSLVGREAGGGLGAVGSGGALEATWRRSDQPMLHRPDCLHTQHACTHARAHAPTGGTRTHGHSVTNTLSATCAHACTQAHTGQRPSCPTASTPSTSWRGCVGACFTHWEVRAGAQLSAHSAGGTRGFEVWVWGQEPPTAAAVISAQGLGSSLVAQYWPEHQPHAPCPLMPLLPDALPATPARQCRGGVSAAGGGVGEGAEQVDSQHVQDSVSVRGPPMPFIVQPCRQTVVVWMLLLLLLLRSSSIFSWAPLGLP